MKVIHALCALLLTLPANVALADRPQPGPPPAPGKAAWFGLHFIDTSGEAEYFGKRDSETKRIQMATDLVRAELEKHGFTVLVPSARQTAGILNPVHSNGADSRIARGMGADYAVSGEVQKVSNLILSLNLYMRDAETGQTLRAGAVDIRGNTDESVRRGYIYLLKNIIFREE